MTRAGQAEFQKAYKELLKPLVLDKQLLNILAREETINKLRTRIEQKFIFKGQTEQERGVYGGIEEKLGTATTIGVKTPQIAQRQIIEILQNNTLVYLHNGGGSGLINKLNNNGFNYKHVQNGEVQTTDLMLIFRK